MPSVTWPAVIANGEGASDSAEIARRVRELAWYHTLELAPDLETDGWFDLRPYVERFGLPERMEGMRALDVGTWDGFWAFEMERRGANVVALDLDDEADLDWPPRRRPERFSEEARGRGFQLAKTLLGSRVERVVRNVYDATPEELGTFDLVFCGSVLIHLRDQLLALERIAELCAGTFICAEEYDRPASLLPFPVSRYLADRDRDVVFWRPSARTWKRMLWSAGFDEVRERHRFKLKPRDGSFSVPHIVIHASKQPARAASPPRR
jgi:tRNA (mo5U34)-methyltransferase